MLFASLGFIWLHLAFGVWPRAFGFGFTWPLAFWLLASGFWLLAFASLRTLHWVCWPFVFFPLACARGMKTLVISVLTSPFQGEKIACQDTC